MVQSVRIEDAIKNSSLLQNSKADAVRIANIITKAENGEKPIGDTLEFMADKISDKKRNAIIAVGAFIGSVLAYKTLGNKIVPYAKKAVKDVLGLLPKETGAKISQNISQFVNKELKDIKVVKQVSGFLSKANVNKVGDIMEWAGAGLAAIVLGRSANKAGDKIDDEIDLRKLQKKEA